MSFKLKNAGAIYQRRMNAIFHNMPLDIMKCYV